MEKSLIEDAEEASFSLNGMVAGFDENTSAYAHMPTKNPYSHFCFALNIEMSAEEVIERLKKYLAELERGECNEALCIEKKMMQKAYWEKGGLLLRNLEVLRNRLEQEKMINAILKVQNGACYDDFIRCLDNSFAEVARLLSEIHMKITQQTDGQFYRSLKSQHDAEPATTAYEEWMMKEGNHSFKTLKGKQTKEVAEFLRKDPLQHLCKPLQNEIDDVDVNKVIYWMPCDYDREYLLSEEFKKQCVRFRWNISWEGDILKFDYDALGEYLFKNYYKMTDEERQAFFDLDVMVELINRDLKTLPSPPCVGRENEESIGQQKSFFLPEVLATDKAMALWKKAQTVGWVDANYQPMISRTQAALLADTMAERLKIENKWKAFETLWKRKYMRSDYDLALTRKKTLDFQDELKRLFG